VAPVFEINEDKEEKGQWVSSAGRGSYLVDGAFDGPEQYKVSSELIPSMKECIEQGINLTILIYGQTGSGKTYTLFGKEALNQSSCSHSVSPPAESAPPHEGSILSSTINLIYQLKASQVPSIEIGIQVSIFEIYQERLKDLADPNPSKQLKLYENKTDDVIIQGLHHQYPPTEQECAEFIRKALKQRTIGETLMNTVSSRSHTLLKIRVSTTDLETNVILVSDIFLVDLAGSEKVKLNLY